jgi:hypothetical protein
MTKAVSIKTASLIVSVQVLTLSKPLKLKRLVFTFGREFTGLKAGVNRRAERNLSGNSRGSP